MEDQQHNATFHPDAVGAGCDPAVREARALYRRVLAGWAFDSLALRRVGLDRPSFRGWDDEAEPGLRRAA